MSEQSPSPAASPSTEQAPGLAITSLVMGIVSMLGGMFFLVFPILAIVFGHVSRAECNRRGIEAGKGMALAGLILGYICLIPMPVGLMAAMAIPAFQKVRETSQDKAITNNLRQIASAAQQHMLATGKPEVKLEDIVGPGKLITGIQSVDGEDYSALVITIATTEITVIDGDGKAYRYSF